MSAPTVATLYAKNEYSASAVTTHSAVLLANGQDANRRFNLPLGWTRLRLTWKWTFYYPNSDTYSSNLPSTLVRVGLCSNGRSLSNPSNAHMVGIYAGLDGGVPIDWYVNGFSAEGYVSGTFNTSKTNPPGSSWFFSPYAMRAYSNVLGVVNGGGIAYTHQAIPFYNAQWNTSYTASNGFPFHSLSGYGWQTVSIEFVKNAPRSGTSVTVGNPYIPNSAFSYVISDVANYGINIPRLIVRRGSVVDISGSNLYGDYSSWLTWWEALTQDNSTSFKLGSYSTVKTIDEGAYGPLDCVDFAFTCGDPNMRLAIRDVQVVATMEPLSPLGPLQLSSSATTSSINLYWNYNNSGNDGFNIYRSSNGTTFTQIATSSFSASNYTDTTMTLHQPYWYKVNAFIKGTSNVSLFSNTSSASTV